MDPENPKMDTEKEPVAESATGPAKKPKWHRSTWFRIIRTPLAVVVVLGIIGCCIIQPGGTMEVDVKLRADPAKLREEVRALTEDFGGRFFDKPENMAKCRAYIRKKFAAAGAEVEEQAYPIPLWPGKEYNVRGFYGDRSKPRIVIGAHYDSCMAHDDGINPGADDNASGVAGLFGLARLLQKERPDKVCIELVAYSTEEPPFFGGEDMGSYRHAELLSKEGVEVKGVLVLEMIGYFTDEPKSQKYPSKLLKAMYPSEGNFIAVVGGFGDRKLISTCKAAMKGAAPLKVVSTCIPRSVDGVHLSDHRNYWEFDYDAVMITDTSFYRNPNYHMTTDTWDTLDYKRMAQVVTQTHQAVLALANEVGENKKKK
ncbi:MAG: M28 family peptidase [Akkermansiaceae bacterium]|nr:M28 family peptidase [Akkermansiaceae bacterium]